MFDFLKNLFKSKQEEPVVDKPKVTPKIDLDQIEAPLKYSDIKKSKEKPQEPKKRGRKKEGITKTDLNKMTKDELEAYAKKEHKVDLDKRRKKADLVDEVLKLAE